MDTLVQILALHSKLQAGPSKLAVHQDMIIALPHLLCS